MDTCAALDDTFGDADDNDSGCLARDVTGHLCRPRKTLQDTVATPPQTSTLSFFNDNAMKVLCNATFLQPIEINLNSKGHLETLQEMIASDIYSVFFLQ